MTTLSRRQMLDTCINASGELGHPSTIQLDDAPLLTGWYKKLTKSSFAAPHQAH